MNLMDPSRYTPTRRGLLRAVKNGACLIGAFFLTPARLPFGASRRAHAQTAAEQGAQGIHADLRAVLYSPTELAALETKIHPTGVSDTPSSADTSAPVAAQARFVLDNDTHDTPAPFPLIRRKRGDVLSLTLTNALSWPTSLYVDGLRCDNAASGLIGLTATALAPGERQSRTIPLPDSGLYWFCPHPDTPPRREDKTLLGALVVEEDTPPTVEDDCVLMLHTSPDVGADGLPKLLINGAEQAVTRHYNPQSRVRLRLINATGRSVLFIRTTDFKAVVIGIDGQPCDSFVPARAVLPLGPGARYDLLCDLPVSETELRLYLSNSSEAFSARPTLLEGAAHTPVSSPLAPSLSPSAASTLGEQARAVLIVTTQGAPNPAPGPLSNLEANLLLPKEIALQKAKRATLTLTETKAPQGSNARYAINGTSAIPYPEKPLFAVAKDTPVMLSIVNKTPNLQTIRFTGQAVRVLHQFDDGWEPYWRNSIVVTEGHAMSVAFVADRVGKWALESAVDDIRLSGMASWFLVE